MLLPFPTVESNYASSIKHKIKAILGVKIDSFTAAEPQMLAANNVEVLKKEDYFVSRGGSGIRALLYITGDGPSSFLVNIA